MPRRHTTPTRLEVHRLRYHHSGHTGRLLHFMELSDPERRLLRNQIFTRIQVASGSRDMNDVCAEVLTSWGVMCFHPQERRLYSGTVRSVPPLREHRWYKCESCGCLVFNEDYDDGQAQTMDFLGGM